MSSQCGERRHLAGEFAAEQPDGALSLHDHRDDHGPALGRLVHELAGGAAHHLLQGLDLDGAGSEGLLDRLAHSSYICGTNADVITGDDTVTVTVHTDVDMWLLAGVNSSFDVEGSACVAIGITGLEPSAQC